MARRSSNVRQQPMSIAFMPSTRPCSSCCCTVNDTSLCCDFTLMLEVRATMPPYCLVSSVPLRSLNSLSLGRPRGLRIGAAIARCLGRRRPSGALQRARVLDCLVPLLLHGHLQGAATDRQTPPREEYGWSAFVEQQRHDAIDVCFSASASWSCRARCHLARIAAVADMHLGRQRDSRGVARSMSSIAGIALRELHRRCSTRAAIVASASRRLALGRATCRSTVR